MTQPKTTPTPDTAAVAPVVNLRFSKKEQAAAKPAGGGKPAAKLVPAAKATAPAAKPAKLAKRALDEALVRGLWVADLTAVRAEFGDDVVTQRLDHHLKYCAPTLYLDGIRKP
jgi:hypothetical protein